MPQPKKVVTTTACKTCPHGIKMMNDDTGQIAWVQCHHPDSLDEYREEGEFSYLSGLMAPVETIPEWCPLQDANY